MMRGDGLFVMVNTVAMVFHTSVLMSVCQAAVPNCAHLRTAGCGVLA